MIRFAIALACAALLAACASDTALRVGIASSNTLGTVLQAVDDDMAAQQKIDRGAALLAHPNDSVAYGAQLADDNARADALSAAWHAHGLLRVVLTVWQGSDDHEHPPPQWQHAAACAAFTLRRLGDLLSPQWRDTLSVVAAPLEAAHLARDDPCGWTP